MMPFTSLVDAATGFFVGIPLVFLIILAIGSIFWLWMLVDAITNTSLNGTEKIVWVLVVLFLHFIGALLYFFLARGKGGSPSI